MLLLIGLAVFFSSPVFAAEAAIMGLILLPQSVHLIRARSSGASGSSFSTRAAGGRGSDVIMRLTFFLFLVHLLFFLFSRVRIEERTLEQQFGDAFRQRRRCVARFIPGVF